MSLTQVNSAGIADGAIVNADVNNSAAVALSKLSTSGTASSSTFLRGDGAWTAIDLANLSASNLTSGTVPDARFPATLPALSGTALTNLNASNISSGTLAAARLPASYAVLSGSTDNTIATVTGANAIQGEANLTFDGSSLVVGTTTHYQLILKDTNHTGNAAETALAFKASDDSDLGLVGYNSWQHGDLSLQNSTSGKDVLIKTHNGSAIGERLRISSGGEIAIGGSARGNRLTVVGPSASQSGANSGTVTDALAMFYGGKRTTSTDLTLDEAIIHIKGQITDSGASSTGNHTTGKIVFSGRRATGAQAWIEHETNWVYNTQNAGSTLKFHTAAASSNGGTAPSERVRITHDGKVGIGCTPAYPIHLAGEGIAIDRNAGDPYIALRTSDDTKVSIYGGASTGFRVFTKPSGGSSAERVRILPGGGLTFNADTAAANALSDYEQGNWTPTLIVSGLSGQAVTLLDGGRYTKVGNRIWGVAYFRITNIGSGGGSNLVYIGGLPYTSGNGHGAAAVHYWGGLSSDLMYITGTVQNNSSEILIRRTTAVDNGISNMPWGDLATNCSFILSFDYDVG